MFFGTNGIRRKYEDMPPDFISNIISAYGKWINHKKVLLARDTRITGEYTESAIIAGLLRVGVQPILLGVLPSPAVEYLSYKYKIPHIIITSSHNPPEWIGLKMSNKKCLPMTKEEGLEVEQIYKKKDWKTCKWNEIPEIVRRYDLVEEYKMLLIKNGIDMHKVKILMDCANGASAVIAPYVFREFGAKVITLNCQQDGHFPGHNSEPTKSNLRDLIEGVKAMKADIGIAYDGDADRLILIDEKGNYLEGDQVFALASEILLENIKGDIVTTVATSSMVEKVAEKHGQKIKYVKVGTPYISEELNRGSYAGGGEGVGGMIWPENPGKDGILTSIKIVSWLIKKGLKLSEAVEKYLRKMYVVKKKIKAGENRFEIVEKIKEKFTDQKNVLTIDGIRISREKGWYIIRASGTEEYIRVIAEGESLEDAKNYIKEGEEILKEYIYNQCVDQN